MNIACPECSTVYRIDPERIPPSRAATRCRACDQLFRVEPAPGQEPGGVITADRAPEAATAASPATTATTAAESEPTEEPGTPQPGSAEPAPTEPVTPEPTAPQPEATGPATTEPSTEASTATGGGGGAATGAPVFGPQDPDTRARRLARALVSDIKVYNPDKWEESRQQGTLRAEFRDEILKSWEEYVEQVGEDMAKKTPYFRDALNDILAAGNAVF